MKLYSVKVVARTLDLSERRVRQLRDEGIIQEEMPGLYNLTKTNHDYINFLRGNSSVEGKLNYNEERAKLVRAKRQNEELDLKIKQSYLHETEDIEAVMGEMLTNFKVRLLGIPSKLSPILATKKSKTDIYKILKDAVEEALNELSDFGTAFNIESGEGENGEEKENSPSDI